MNKIVFTLIDRSYNVKSTQDRTLALSWIRQYYARDGRQMTRSVLFSLINDNGHSSVPLFSAPNDEQWTMLLTRANLK